MRRVAGVPGGRSLSAGVGRRPAQRLVRLVDRGQQLNVGQRVELRETPSPIDRHPDPTAGRVARDQPRHLRPAQPGHLFHLAPKQTPSRLALLSVLVFD
jgi:hypothetical protein